MKNISFMTAYHEMTKSGMVPNNLSMLGTFFNLVTLCLKYNIYDMSM